MKTITVFFFVLFVPALAFAHPGNTDSKGGHTCKTNCPKWGLAYGQYHTHKKPVQSVAPVVKKPVAPVVKPAKPVVKPATSAQQKVYVKGYYRKDGTYVKGYWRNK
jgi:hypothetical protein